jgi:xanthine dehydrogenase accessory factor
MTIDSDEIIECMAKLKEQRQPFVLATVVRTEELTAAKAGAKAVIRADGSIIGWVGGGCTLGAVKKAAAEALKTGKSKLIHIKPAALAEAEAPVEGVDVHKSGCPSGGTEEVFIEPILPKPALIVMGASSAAHALCDLGRRMGFWVTVAARADDLPGFKAADETVEGFDFADDPRTEGAFIVVATQGNRDRDAVRSAVSSDAAYVAFIGSRRKTEKLKADLLAEGMAAEKLDALHAPAGLDIGAVTPDEIALSILAEIVQERSKAGQGSKKSVVSGTSASTG